MKINRRNYIMNKFLNSFVFPVLVFFAVIFTAYTAVMYSYKKIKSDPINIKYATMQQRDSEMKCLTENIYMESAGENFEGKVSVAQITVNRANSKKFGRGVCGEVFASHQFSWTIEKPRALRVRNKEAYAESERVAKKVLLEGYRLPSLVNAEFYHNTSVNPSWNRNMKRVAKIGNHIFYEG
jgi:spore germination cell wall hydrolase CwlJ-like protein